MSKQNFIGDSPLGRQTEYVSQYCPSLLSPIPRSDARVVLGINSAALPFDGKDVWTAYELSWLNNKGKPLVALGRFAFPCTSPWLIESKSLKLYLNSLNQSRFGSIEEVRAVIEADLGAAAGAPVEVYLEAVDSARETSGRLPGHNLDHLDVEVCDYEPNAGLLGVAHGDGERVEEILCSDLLKSNCPVTGQPDWASIMVKYRGPAIDRAGLLKYIISFREHQDFHENCVERIFTDILDHCAPERLTVLARYTRRGGLDINPYRSNCGDELTDLRLIRQ